MNTQFPPLPVQTVAPDPKALRTGYNFGRTASLVHAQSAIFVTIPDDLWVKLAKEMRKARLLAAAATLHARGEMSSQESADRALLLEERLEKEL